MLKIAGYLVVLCSVLGGFMLSGGKLAALWHPFEILIIGGAAFGAASNPALLAALPFTSPRLVGEGALAAGDGVRMAGNALSAAQQQLANSPRLDAGLRYAADSATSQPVADARRLRAGGMLDRAATEESESDARIRQLLNIPQSALIQQ